MTVYVGDQQCCVLCRQPTKSDSDGDTVHVGAPPEFGTICYRYPWEQPIAQPVIGETTFTFTVMHRIDQPVDDLEEAMERAETGHAVGLWVQGMTRAVPNSQVPARLQALNNDGTFFDDDLNSEED